MASPLEQFAIQDLTAPLFNIGGHHIAVTNSAIFMMSAVVLSSGLLLAGAGKGAMIPGRIQAMGELFYEFIANMIRDNVGSGGNTVMVNNGRPMDQRRYGPPPPGYRSGGYYYGGGYYYDDNDNEFLEFVGKTAAVTAGAAIVGSILTSKPTDSSGGDCKEQMSGGQVYLYCNGKYYQPVQTGSGTGYQVVNPPPK